MIVRPRRELILPSRQRGFISPAMLGVVASFRQSDPAFSNVVLLVHGNGVNGGTTITDSSVYARVCTPGGCTTSTAQAKFGGSSILHAPSVAHWPASTDLSFIAGQDFTLEIWIYFTSLATSSFFIARSSGTTSGRWGLGTAGLAGKLALWFNGSTIVQEATAGMTTGTWYHVSYSRGGTTGRLFLDGALVGSVSDSNNYVDADVLTLGGDSTSALGVPSGTYFNDLRITRAARYTAAFTRPSAPFPNR